MQDLERTSVSVDAVHMVGGLGGLTKMEAKRRLDCQAWNLQSVTSAYACNGSESRRGRRRSCMQLLF